MNRTSYFVPLGVLRDLSFERVVIYSYIFFENTASKKW